MTTKRYALALTPLAIFFALSIQARASLPLPKVTIGYATITRMAPLWISYERGFFIKYGVEAEQVFVRNSPVLTAALVSGGIDLGIVGGNPVLSAAAGGADLRIVATLASHASVDLIARAGIKSAKELRGKRVGVQSIGGTTWLYTIFGLEQLGLDLHRDKILTPIIGEYSILAQALESGTIDAVFMSVPAFSRRLNQKGFPILAKLSVPVAGNVFVATGAYLRQHSDAMENVLKALLEGLAYVLDPANKGSVFDTLMKHLKISDPALLEETYRSLFKELDRKPYPSLEPMENIQRIMKNSNPQLADVNVAALIDNSLIRKLDESGFIDRVYKNHGAR